jgi:hypothetical protein
MKDEHNVLWLASAFRVLSPRKCGTSIDGRRDLKVLAKKKRTAKRHARKKT